MAELNHDFSFDPRYGYSTDALLQIKPPEAPVGFADFWRRRYEQAIRIDADFALRDTGKIIDARRVLVFELPSTNDVILGGWILLPIDRDPTRAFVVTHGYGGRDEPNFDLPFPDALIVFPCLRGMSRSRHPGIPEDAWRHVLHGIEDPDTYVIGGCVEDVWVTVTAILRFEPRMESRIGYCGESFGGGIGALACPWDHRIARTHLALPTFGHHPIRLQSPCNGSGEAVRRRYLKVGDPLMKTLQWYDAATAATFFQHPTHCAPAAFDPSVPPPGQYAIANALPRPTTLHPLSAGHFEYPQKESERKALRDSLATFFAPLASNH